MSFLKAQNTISGTQGKLIATINGSVYQIGEVKSFEATVDKNKSEMKVVGKTGTQHKGSGWNGSGSMTLYYGSPIFRRMMIEYMKTGKDTYFDVTCVNEDPGSGRGKQTATIRNVNIDSMTIAILDAESDMLEEDLDFTYDDVDILDEFGNVVYG